MWAILIMTSKDEVEYRLSAINPKYIKQEKLNRWNGTSYAPKTVINYRFGTYDTFNKEFLKAFPELEKRFFFAPAKYEWNPHFIFADKGELRIVKDGSYLPSTFCEFGEKNIYNLFEFILEEITL